MGRALASRPPLLLPLLMSLLLIGRATPLQLPDIPLGGARVRHVHFSAADGSRKIRDEQIHAAVRAATPTVFTGGGLVAGWAALDKWSDPGYLSWAFGQEDVRVKVSADPTFILYALDERRPEALQGGAATSTKQGFAWEDMKVEDIFGSSRFKYFTGEVPTAAAADVNLANLAVKLVNDSLNDTASRGMLWMSSAGVTAQMHHDRSYNFFAQIVGRKAFYLLPPVAYSTLNMHPSFHGSRRQSQKVFAVRTASDDEVSGSGHGRSFAHPAHSSNLDSTDLECSSTGQKVCHEASAMEIFLNPGDVLYVPPFWFHTVVSLSPMTVSYSVLSPSEEEMFFGDALYARVNFGTLRNDPPRTLRLAVVAYINRILQQLGKDSREFMSTLGTTRHGLLAAGGVVETDKLWCRPKSRLERMKIEKRLRPGLFQALKNVTETFRNHYDHNQGGRDILLGDLFEELLVFTSSQGNYAHTVRELIQRCWMLD